jgi:TRAP-type C4-dicarboxylate transport system substrate-binding protein
LKKLATLYAALVVSLLVNTAVQARTLKLQSSSKAGSWAYRFMTDDWQGRFNTMTGGELKMEVLPSQAIVPNGETIDAVASGILDGDLNWVASFADRDPAFALFGDLIGAYDRPEQLQSFCTHGGGRDILQKMYDEHTDGKLYVVGCGAYAREAFVSTRPIETLADLKDIRIRLPDGLATQVFKRAGAVPVALPFSEVYAALEKDQIDAADASTFVINNAAGLHKVAPYPIYPGIHSMAVLQFVINRELWDSLSPAHRIALETWYLAASASMRRGAELQDRTLVAEHNVGDEVTVVSWPQGEREAFRNLAMPVWREFAAKSELAKEALDAHLNYMKMIGLIVDIN